MLCDQECHCHPSALIATSLAVNQNSEHHLPQLRYSCPCNALGKTRINPLDLVSTKVHHAANSQLPKILHVKCIAQISQVQRNPWKDPRRLFLWERANLADRFLVPAPHLQFTKPRFSGFRRGHCVLLSSLCQLKRQVVRGL